MKRYTLPALSMACTRLAVALAACALVSPHITAQTEPPAITLDAPTGSGLQAHAFDVKGTRLPESPANFRRLGEAQVGQKADIQTLTFRFAKTATLTGIKSTKDFQIESGGSCAHGNTYQAKSTCTLLVRFTPQGAGNRLGRLSISTNLSPTPMAFGLGGYGYAPILSFVPSVISTVAGTYPSSVGLLNGAQNLAIDASDTLWVADTGNGLIRQFDSSATWRTFASGYTGAYGVAVDTFGQAYFDVPSTGKMYEIYDYGPVVQVSGTGTIGCPAATPCTLNSEALGTPGEMSMDPYNHLFFVDSHQGAAFSTVQPTPANLIFLYDPFPYQQSPAAAMAVDASDNLYSLWANGGVCEIVQQSLYNAENNNVSFNKIAGGHTCGFAGDGGLGGNAEIGAKVGQIAFDTAGDLYFTDQANQRVRRIDYATGVIRTIAGTGSAGYSGDFGSSLLAQIANPTGVGVDSQGSVYVVSGTASSGSAQVIRQLGPRGLVHFANQSKGTASSTNFVTVTNTGNSSMTLTTSTITGTNPGDFKINTAATSCVLTAGAVLSSGQSCNIGFTFTPSATGVRSANFQLLNNTITGTNTVVLVGTGTLPVPSMVITSPANGASFTSGTAVTFSVSVTNTTTPQPTGTVQFKVDGANFGSPVTLSGTGTASTSVTGLTQTSHTLSATYSGDANYAAAGPVSVSVVVTAVKVLSAVSLSPLASAGSCSAQQFIAMVSSKSAAPPTGQVTLLDGTRSVASGTLTNGKVTLSPAMLGPGAHSLTAHYAGDSLHTAATSPSVVQAGKAIGFCKPVMSAPAPRVEVR